MHIVFNRIDNNGKTITDKNDRYRNERVCKQLKRKHGLYFAPGKVSVKQDRLKEPDKTKYEIYTALKSSLKHSKDWQQLHTIYLKTGYKSALNTKGRRMKYRVYLLQRENTALKARR